MPTSLTFFTLTGDYRNITDPVLYGSTNTASVEIVSALVDIRPRVPSGFVTYVNDYQISANANEVQYLRILGNPTSGTWTVNFQGQVSANIAWNATAAAVQTAIQALSNVGNGNVSVTGSAASGYTVTFINAKGNQPLSQIITNQALAGGTIPRVDVSTITEGSTAATRDTAIALPTRHARIWEGRLCTINLYDTLDVKLVADTPDLGIAQAGLLYDPPVETLIYDVEFSKVTFAEADQTIRNFAFQAPSTATTISLTDPALERLVYEPRL